MLRLLTIPISHYCDKARWGLEVAGLDYVEEGHLQMFHYFPALWHGRTAYVPVLVHTSGSVIESTEILRWTDRQGLQAGTLFPAEHEAAVLGWCADLDEGLGVDGRLWMYQQLLSRPEQLIAASGHGVPRWQHWILRTTFPFARAYVRRRLTVSDTTSKAAVQRCVETFDRIAATVGPEGYLVGDRFTAADLTFAALSAPLTAPPQYGIPLPKLEELHGDYRRVVERFRAHPAGVLALRHYTQHRAELQTVHSNA